MSSDEHVRAAYASALAEWQQARDMIQRDGIVVADEKGRPVPHPALAVERSASAEMRAWLGELRKLEQAAGNPTDGW